MPTFTPSPLAIGRPIVNIVGISGSLRAASVNTALLKAIAALAPAHVNISLFIDMASMPLFNPDLEGREAAPVHRLRAALRDADAVLIASPEYAHGVTGVIKNALDWVVGSGELVGKPVAFLSASTRAIHAPEALRKTLRAMDAHIVDGACLAVPVNNSRASEAELLAMPDVTAVLLHVLATLARTAQSVAPAAAMVDDEPVTRTPA
ncbi:MAG: NADPH-dependent FMN reductase [Pseudomonadota bacterium]